jgi:condensin-2 complex subunit G2
LGISSLGTILQDNIALLCEIVYTQFPNEEMSHELVPQTIPLLLANSLQKGAKKNDVKRVWNMREALNLLEYEEESVLQELLLRCIISPLYLNSVEGKKFLYFIFNMNPVLIELVHSTIVAQVKKKF